MRRKDAAVIVLAAASVLLTYVLIGIHPIRERSSSPYSDTDRQRIAEMRPVALAFINAWADINYFHTERTECFFAGKTSGASACFYDLYEHGRVGEGTTFYAGLGYGGYFYRFGSIEPACCLVVPENQRMVTVFAATGNYLSLPNWRKHPGTTRDQWVEGTRNRVRVRIEVAQARAAEFVMQVYPDFARRDFHADEGKLRIWPLAAFYEFVWRETCDFESPKTFPNEIRVAVDPETGIITDYSAENRSLPAGFKFGMTAAEAEKDAELCLVQALTDPDAASFRDLSRWQKQPTRLRYLVRRSTDKDQICWAVLYTFQVDQGPKEAFCRVYDAKTGAAVSSPWETRGTVYNVRAPVE